MITKKKVLLHVFWGAIFGLIAGIAFAYYGNGHNNIRSLLNSLSVGKVGRSYVYLEPVSKTLQMLLYFLVPGLCLGLSLGIADRSFKKLIYSSFGGLFGGAIYYFVAQTVKSSTPKEAVLLISPIIYALTIALMLGIFYRSIGKAIKSFIGGVAGWLIVMPVVFFVWMFTALASGWGMATDLLVKFIVANMIIYFLMILSLTLGISTGSEWGKEVK